MATFVIAHAFLNLLALLRNGAMSVCVLHGFVIARRGRADNMVLLEDDGDGDGDGCGHSGCDCDDGDGDGNGVDATHAHKQLSSPCASIIIYSIIIRSGMVMVMVYAMAMMRR